MQKPNGDNNQPEIDSRFWKTVDTEWPLGKQYFESVPPDVREQAIDVTQSSKEADTPTALQTLGRLAIGSTGVIVYRFVPWISEVGGDVFSSIRTALLRH